MSNSTNTVLGVSTDKPVSLEQRWEAQISRWSETGLSKSAYCKQTGVDYHQMIYWSRKLSTKNDVQAKARANTSSSPKGSGFLAVSVTPSTADLFLRLPNGIEIGGIDEQRLSHIIQLVSR